MEKLIFYCSFESKKTLQRTLKALRFRILVLGCRLPWSNLKDYKPSACRGKRRFSAFRTCLVNEVCDLVGIHIRKEVPRGMYESAFEMKLFLGHGAQLAMSALVYEQLGMSSATGRLIRLPETDAARRVCNRGAVELDLDTQTTCCALVLCSRELTLIQMLANDSWRVALFSANKRAEVDSNGYYQTLEVGSRHMDNSIL